MIIYNYYVAILILAVIFYTISDKNISILLSLIIIIIIGYYYFNKIYDYNKTVETNFNNKVELIKKDIKDRETFNDDNY